MKIVQLVASLAALGLWPHPSLGLRSVSSDASQLSRQQQEMLLNCDDFIEGFESLHKAAGLKSHQKLSRSSCPRLMRLLSKDYPDVVPSVINLGKFYESRSFDPNVRSNDVVPDVASDMIRHRGRKLRDGDGHDEIPVCESPAYGEDSCPHDPCIPGFLQPDPNDDMIVYDEFDPDYGGWPLALAPLRLGWEGNTLWNGEDVDRTDDSNVGILLIASIAAVSAATVNEHVCDLFEDDLFNNCVLPPVPVVPIPNPAKIVCHVILATLQTIQLSMEHLLALADYQDGGVNGAEIEAGYEHTKNLLQKQCAIYDQAVCRCVVEEHLIGDGSYGLGCDGKDSNCNDLVDDCDEDNVPPEIVIDDSLCACNNGWFSNVTAAEICVENSMTISDDCQKVTNIVVSGEDMCENSNVTITAQDSCDNEADPKTVPVQIDGEAPQVTCGFLQESAMMTNLVITADTTGPSVLMDSHLDYNATDNCNGPLNVTVKVYSNEIEDFNAQKLALFYKTAEKTNDEAGLFVAKGICSTVRNGQCIKEDDFMEQRLYTVEVTAVDQAGLSNTTKCYIEIQPKGNSNLKGGGSTLKDISESKQRFLLTTYSSIFV